MHITHTHSHNIHNKTHVRTHLVINLEHACVCVCMCDKFTAYIFMMLSTRYQLMSDISRDYWVSIDLYPSIGKLDSSLTFLHKYELLTFLLLRFDLTHDSFSGDERISSKEEGKTQAYGKTNTPHVFVLHVHA